MVSLTISGPYASIKPLYSVEQQILDMVKERLNWKENLHRLKTFTDIMTNVFVRVYTFFTAPV